MSFQDGLMRAEAIREIRASGCTTEGIAELIVDFHGAVHILTNVPKIQLLGEQVAASDSEQGAKMRQLLLEAASKAEAVAQQKAAGTQPPAQLVSTNANDDAATEAANWLMREHGYTAGTAKEIVAKEGSEAILGEKKWKQRKESEDAQNTSKPAESQAAADASAGTGAGSVSDAAAEATIPGTPAAAAGTSEVPGQSTAQEKPARKGKGQAQGS